MARIVSRWLAGAVLCTAIVLAACVTTRLPREPLTIAQQRDALQSLQRYTMQGRVAVSGVANGFNANTAWQQQSGQSRLRLSGPLGAGAMEIHYADGQLHIAGSRGESFAGDDANRLLEQQLGFVPPVDALRYWILGVPAPGGEVSADTTDASGNLSTFSQLGWVLHIDALRPESTALGEVLVPTRLTATRGTLRLRMVMDRWTLGR
jgi:outer membrane lipoprotein LolB